MGGTGDTRADRPLERGELRGCKNTNAAADTAED